MLTLMNLAVVMPFILVMKKCKIFGVGRMERWRIAGSDGREKQVPLLVAYTRPMYWIFMSDITSSAAGPWPVLCWVQRRTGWRGEEGRLKAAWDKRSSTRLRDVGVSEDSWLSMQWKTWLCSALPCGVGSRGGGGSCGFASVVKEVVVQKISKAASCVWFSPLQPGLAELASPAKFSHQGPERIFFLPCLGPQAQQGAPRRICGWKHITAMQGMLQRKVNGGTVEETWQFFSPVDFFLILR